MPKIALELKDIHIRRLEAAGGKRPITKPVGGVAGLMIQVTPNGGKSWLLRTTIAKKRREIGLGGYPTVTLAEARERAREALADVRQGIDPIEKRKAAQSALIAAQSRGLTFAKATEQYLSGKVETFRNKKHRAQWASTLEQYAMPHIGKMLVSDITVHDVERVLKPIWSTKTVTASRVRGRIEKVLAWATVKKHRTGDNPAAWRGNLDQLFNSPAKVKKGGNQPALPIDYAPSWFADLRQREGNGARALEFAALTAARSGEVLGATWDEINLDNGMWTVPASRMKAGKEHRVPLPAAAVALLKAVPKTDGSEFVFASPNGGKFSDMAMSAVMRRMHADKAVKEVAAGVPEDRAGWRDPKQNYRPAVPHGLRSTFRDWVAEKTDFPGDMAEIALAHTVANAVEAAYRRGDMVEKRRSMMDAWAAFLSDDGRGG
jgi:integrase